MAHVQDKGQSRGVALKLQWPASAVEQIIYSMLKGRYLGRICYSIMSSKMLYLHITEALAVTEQHDSDNNTGEMYTILGHKTRLMALLDSELTG